MGVRRVLVNGIVAMIGYVNVWIWDLLWSWTLEFRVFQNRGRKSLTLNLMPFMESAGNLPLFILLD